MPKLLWKYIPKKFQDYIVDIYKDEDGYWCLFDSNVILENERRTANGQTIKELLNDIRQNAVVIRETYYD